MALRHAECDINLRDDRPLSACIRIPPVVAEAECGVCHNQTANLPTNERGLTWVSLDREDFVLPAIASTGVSGFVALAARRLRVLDLTIRGSRRQRLPCHRFRSAVADAFLAAVLFAFLERD